MRKIVFISLMVVFVSACFNVEQTSSYAGEKRVRMSFDFGWKFHKGDLKGAEKGSFDDSGWRDIDVPHDWSVEGPFSKEHSSGTGYLPGGIGWYRKTFEVPAEAEGKKVVVEFDGVYRNSKVWINGHYLGERPYGYISFYYDLTDYLKYGEENLLAVQVNRSEVRDSRWYTGSGIYRHVRLTITDNVHVGQWGTYITTPEVSNKNATVDIKTVVENENADAREVRLVTSILDGESKVIKSVESSGEVEGEGKYEFTQQVNLNKPRLWSVEEPYLYTALSEVKVGGKVVDDYQSRFGVREFYFDADEGFFLNGKNMKIKGVCVHHDGGSVGAAVPKRVWERRFEILKGMGCNGIRTSHNPPAPELLDLCDEMGFVVMDEAFDEWELGKRKWVHGWNKGIATHSGYNEYFEDWGVHDLREMIRRDRNHPSIILWSIGNEIDYPTDPYSHPVDKNYDPKLPRAEKLVPIAKRLIKALKELDTMRPVTAGLANIPASNKTGLADLLDVVGYNYHEWCYEQDHKDYPQRKIIGSENRHPYEDWLAVADNDYVTGQFVWTGFDYLGESGGWPLRGWKNGLIDLCGFKKPRCYFKESLWSEEPMVYVVCRELDEDASNVSAWEWQRVVEHWNWEGNEGKTVTVECYTNCERAELFLNGKSLGEKELSSAKKGVLIWEVGYEAGTLKAVGLKRNKEICSFELVTAGEAAKIVLSADRNVIKSDGQDVSNIAIYVVDEKGTIIADADNLISLEVEGDGKLIGFGSGDQWSHEDYKSNKRKSYSGKSLAIVQSNHSSGRIKVTASSEGLISDSILIVTEK